MHILFAKIIILHCLFHRQGLCTEAKSSNRRGTFPIVSPTLENLGGMSPLSDHRLMPMTPSSKIHATDVRGIFFRGSKVNFPNFFFPGKKKKKERKERKVFTSFGNFFLFPFQFPPSLFRFFLKFYFPSFLLYFPFFIASLFPVGSRSAEISQWKMSGGHSSPAPPPVTPLGTCSTGCSMTCTGTESRPGCSSLALTAAPLFLEWSTVV